MREYRPVQVYLLVFAALLATAYVAPKTFSFSDGLDFRLIWLAGKLWTAGENPYGSQFHDVYLNEFGSGPNTHFWVYPPYWYPISVMLGKLPYHSSLLIWRLLNITLLYFSAHMVAQTISTSRTQYVVHFFFCLTFSEILQATAVTMAIGQTSILVYFGMAAVFKGWLRGSFPYLCLGIAVLALKPNVALPILAALLLVPKGPTAMVSVMAGFALAQIPISGLFSQWRDFGVAVARYSDPQFSANTASNLVGLVHLLSFIPNVIATLLAGILAAALAMALRKAPSERRGIGDDFMQAIDRQVSRIFPQLPLIPSPDAESDALLCSSYSLLVISIFLLVPLHTYDVVAITIPIAIMFSSGAIWSPFNLVGTLLILRPGNVYNLTGFKLGEGTIFPESTIATAGLCLLFFGALLSLFKHVEQVQRRTSKS